MLATWCGAQAATNQERIGSLVQRKQVAGTPVADYGEEARDVNTTVGGAAFATAKGTADPIASQHDRWGYTTTLSRLAARVMPV
jgi:hypothetical protein